MLFMALLAYAKPSFLTAMALLDLCRNRLNRFALCGLTPGDGAGEVGSGAEERHLEESVLPGTHHRPIGGRSDGIYHESRVP